MDKWIARSYISQDYKIEYERGNIKGKKLAGCFLANKVDNRQLSETTVRADKTRSRRSRCH